MSPSQILLASLGPNPMLKKPHFPFFSSNFLIQCESGAAAFIARFGPIWLRIGVRVGVGDRGGVGPTPVSLSHQEVLPSPQYSEQPDPRKVDPT